VHPLHPEMQLGGDAMVDIETDEDFLRAAFRRLGT
jgi:hypothetical protein